MRPLRSSVATDGRRGPRHLLPLATTGIELFEIIPISILAYVPLPIAFQEESNVVLATRYSIRRQSWASSEDTRTISHPSLLRNLSSARLENKKKENYHSSEINLIALVNREIRSGISKKDRVSLKTHKRRGLFFSLAL